MDTTFDSLSGATYSSNRIGSYPDDEFSLYIESLLAKIALKDQQAFKRLYDNVSTKLTGLAMRILDDYDLSNDVLQETFIQVWDRAGEYRRHLGAPMAWIYALLRYRALDKLKSEQRVQLRHQAAVTLGFYDQQLDQDPNEFELNQAQFRATLQQQLAAMNMEQRNAIIMAYYQGHSRKEIAVYCDAPINTVKSWLKRGIAELSTKVRPNQH